MGVRRVRKDLIIADQKTSRRENGVVKVKERARRDKRMRELVQSGTPPYTPAVRSWLSMQADMPARLMTQEDIDRVMKTDTDGKA